MLMKLLIIIDMQQGFRSEESERLLENIKALIRRFGEKNAVFACFRNAEGSAFGRKLGWKGLQNAEDTNIIKELDSKDIRKVWHSGYTVLNTDMKNLLKERGIDRIFICGVYTDVCVIKAAMDFFDAGFDVFVIEDVCASLHKKSNHDSAIESMKHIIGKENVIRAENI